MNRFILYFTFTAHILLTFARKEGICKPEPHMQQTNNRIFYGLPEALGAFSGCVTRLINYQGLNINGNSLQEPVLLQRYYPNKAISGYPLIPMEIEEKNLTKIYEYLGLPRSQNPLLFSLKYNFVMASRNTICDSNIHILPPSPSFCSQMYWRLDKGLLLKEPVLMDTVDNLRESEWKISALKVEEKHNLLIGYWPSISWKFQTFHIWFETNWLLTPLVTTHTTFLLWDIISNRLYIMCENCDPCQPFYFRDYMYTPRSRHELQHLIKLAESESMGPLYYANLVPGDSPDWLWDLRLHSTKKNMLNSAVYLKRTMPEKMQNLLDIHVISILLPDNSTADFFPNLDKEILDIPMTRPGCPNIGIHQRAVARFPGFWRHNGKLVAEFGATSLVTRIDRLRFVSCHREEISWLVRLLELITAFDVYTWLCLGVVTIVVTLVASGKCKDIIFVSNTKWNKRSFQYFSTFDVVYQMFAAFLDQGSNLFHSWYIKENTVIWWALIVVPLMLSLVGNEYKGDNIYRLTVTAPLVPFDTFGSLVKHNFDIYTLPKHLSHDDQAIWSKDSSGMIGVNQHEALPVVSQLLFNINIMFIPAKNFSQILKEAPLKLKIILNNTKLFPSFQNITYDEHGEYSYEQFISPLFQKCVRSAAILDDALALIVHTKYSKNGAPVHFGKEPVFQNLRGYEVRGMMPTEVISRIKHLTHTGIIEWWMEYFKLSIVQMTYSQRNSDPIDNGSELDEGLSLRDTSAIITILGVGLLIALLVFLLHEIRAKILKLYCDLKTKFFLLYYDLKTRVLVKKTKVQILQPEVVNDIGSGTQQFT